MAKQLKQAADEIAIACLASRTRLLGRVVTGIYDDGTPVEGPMKGIIDNGTSRLTEADALAIAQYLKSLPPVASE